VFDLFIDLTLILLVVFVILGQFLPTGVAVMIVSIISVLWLILIVYFFVTESKD